MRRGNTRQYRRTTLQLVCFLAVLVGLAAARSWSYGLCLSLGVAAALICALCGTIRLRHVCTVAICVAIAWQHGTAVARSYEVYDDYFGRVVTVYCTALSDATYGFKSQLTTDAGQVVIGDRHLPGRLQVSGFGVNAIFVGDELVVTGKLQPAYGSYQAEIGFAHIQVIRHHGNAIATIRRNFAAGLQSVLPEPQAPFAMGLLVGQRSNLPKPVKAQLLAVGLTHIIAVSGYNLTIMLRASQRVLGTRSKRLSTWAALSMMALFLLLTGASASIVRAAIVSTLSIAAAYYGRSFRPLNLICLAAVITAWANPLYIWSDASWWLSFLAFFGVVVVSPLLTLRLPQAIAGSTLVLIGIESISAELMTLPYILHNFGQMSLIGLAANVLVVALIPLGMLLCLVAGLAGMLLIGIAGWFAWPARILLTYMLDVANLLSHVPHTFLAQRSFSTAQMVIAYGAVAVFITMLHFKTAATSGKITDRIVHTAKEVRV